jgi:ferredoxin
MMSELERNAHEPSVHRLKLEPAGFYVDVLEDETLLDALLRLGFEYPHGCKRGMCGACKARLVAGSVSADDTSEFALLDDEKEDGFILLCSSRATSDVVVEGPE